MRNRRSALGRLLVGLFVMVLSLGLAATAAAQDESQKNIPDVLAASGHHTTLLALLKDCDLDKALANEGPFTVFAPTDEAFAKLSPETLAMLRADREKLKAILSYHVVSGRIAAEPKGELQSPSTLGGQPLSIRTSDAAMTVNDTRILETKDAKNGVVYSVGAVLVPPGLDLAPPAKAQPKVDDKGKVNKQDEKKPYEKKKEK